MIRVLWAVLFSLLLLVTPGNAGFSIGGWPAMTTKDGVDPAKAERFEELKRAFIRDYRRSIPNPVTPEIVRRRKEIYDLALEVAEPSFALASQMDGYGLVLVAGGHVADAQPVFEAALNMRLEDAGADARWKSRAYEAYASAKLRSAGREAEALAAAHQAVGYWHESQLEGPDEWVRNEKEIYVEWDSDGIFDTYSNALWANAKGSQSIPLETKRKALEAAQRALVNHEALALYRLTAREIAAQIGGELPGLLARRDAAFVQRAVDRQKFTAAAKARLASTKNAPITTSGADPRSVKELEAEAAGERVSELIRELSRRIDREWPEYRQAAFPDPMALETVQQMLGEDEAAIVIGTSTRGTQVLAVNRTSIEWQESPIGFFGLVEAVKRLRWFAGADVKATEEQELAWLASVDGGINGFDRETAYRLYQQLFKAVEPIFKGKQVLYVATDDPLDSLPLAILVSAPPQGRDDDPTSLRATRWFGDDIAIATLPSLRALASIRKRPATKAVKQFAGFGDPLLKGMGALRGHRGYRQHELALPPEAEEKLSESVANGLVSPTRLHRMARLPGTAQEIQSIASAFGTDESDIFLGSRATERLVRSVSLSQYRIIDFATHGALAGELGRDIETGLVFTPPGSPTPEDDGYLTASEVRRLTLDADWVILSACNTAGGNDLRSTGSSGLAHGFFTAGARSLLLSHWPVRDDVAPVLILNAVGGPKQARASRAEALQRAMKMVRDNASRDGIRRDGIDQTWAHPNAWAAFGLVGEGL